jgi:hypothetical protein
MPRRVGRIERNWNVVDGVVGVMVEGRDPPVPEKTADVKLLSKIVREPGGQPRLRNARYRGYLLNGRLTVVIGTRIGKRTASAQRFQFHTKAGSTDTPSRQQRPRIEAAGGSAIAVKGRGVLSRRTRIFIR